MKERNKNKILADAAVSACNAYIESIFSVEKYEDLSASERMRINCVLIQTNKLASKFQA